MIDKRFYELIAHLWRGGQYGYYWLPDDGSGQKYTYWTKPSAADVPKLFLDKDAYFAVNPATNRKSEHERAKIADIAGINCFYDEVDCKTDEEKRAALEKIAQRPIQPACVTDSGGGYHCFTLLRDTFADIARAADLQWAFAQWAGGDTSVNDLARVLRIPGTINHKPRYAPMFPTVLIVRWDMTQLHDIREIEAILQPYINARDAAKAHTPPAPKRIVEANDDRLLTVLFRSKNGAIYERLARGDYSDVGGDQSVGDQLFCDGLAWITGRDVARMDLMFRQTALMRDKWLRDDYRLSTLQNAADSAQMDYDPFHGVDPQAVIAAEDLIMNGTPPPVTPPNGNNAPPPPNVNSMPVDKQLMAFGANDEGNAQSVYLLYGRQFLYCNAYGYLHYNQRFWESEGAEAALNRAIVATLQQRCVLAIINNQDAILKASKPNAGNVKACLYLLQSLITAGVEMFDADPELLNCNNGVVNLRTGQLLAHTSSQRFTYCVPVDYSPQADCVEWIEFAAKVTSKPEMVDYLQIAVGYTATGYTSEECLFYIHGPSRSGKGTFTETLLSILPKPLGVQADFSTFTAKREGDMQNFDLAPLKPARFVVASESNKYDTLNEAKIKTATGGDWIRCAFKHRDHFEYRPQFKIWLVSNHPIKGDVDDDAFWGRAKVIEFPNSFLGKEDKTLKARMKTPAMLEGVLRWMVDGAMMWFASTGGLSTPQAVIDATNARRNDLDFIQQWLDECCKLDPTAWTTNHDLRTSYEAWCKNEGVATKGAESFSRALSKKGFSVGVYGRTPLGKKARGVNGLSII